MSLDDKAQVKGFECLLQLEKNHHEARFSGVTRLDVSQLFPPAQVNVAALFYISYVFSGKWDHAQGVALQGAHGRINNPSDVRTAYRFYKKWLRQVKKIGLAAARKSAFLPLSHSKVQWY